MDTKGRGLDAPVTRAAPSQTPAALAIGVMAKAPVPGQVKTRLIPLLGAEGSARLHTRLLAQTLATCIEAAPGAVTLFATGGAPGVDWPHVADRFGVNRVEQVGADLGARMHHAIAHLLSHAPAALLVGADCPELDAEHLRAAHLALHGRRLVFIPARDGGYVLVGATQPCLPVFSGIAWGTARVMRGTRTVMRRLGWRRGRDWAELEPLADLDEPQDYLDALARGHLDAVEDHEGPG